MLQLSSFQVFKASEGKLLNILAKMASETSTVSSVVQFILDDPNYAYHMIMISSYDMIILLSCFGSKVGAFLHNLVATFGGRLMCKTSLTDNPSWTQ